MSKSDNFGVYSKHPKKGGSHFLLLNIVVWTLDVSLLKMHFFRVFSSIEKHQICTFCRGVKHIVYVKHTIWGLLTGGHLFIAFPS